MSLKRPGRKLLVASIGVAAVTYVACSDSGSETSGNLMAPPDAGSQDDQFTSGNLVAPEPDDAGDAANDADDSATDAPVDARDD